MTIIVINKIKQDAEQRMKKTIETLHNDLAKIRTGRANPNVLDHVNIDYYGSVVPINQVANIIISDSHTLLVTPWEKAIVSNIEKAILNSGLGLNPVTVGASIRIPMPPLTEERRKEMVRLAKGEGEHGRISLRNIRRDANNHLKEILKNKEISDDDARKTNEFIQKLTDKYVSELDVIIQDKEKDLIKI